MLCCAEDIAAFSRRSNCVRSEISNERYTSSYTSTDRRGKLDYTGKTFKNNLQKRFKNDRVKPTTVGKTLTRLRLNDYHKRFLLQTFARSVIMIIIISWHKNVRVNTLRARGIYIAECLLYP